MSTEENKALARRSWEIVNQRNPDLIEELYPPDFVWHEPDQDLRGYEQAKQFVSTFFAAMPEINIAVEDMVAEGDQVVSRYTIRGTHQGETEGFGPPNWEADGAQRHHHPPHRGRQDSRGVGSIR
jgi:predicted ester cyclase